MYIYDGKYDKKIEIAKGDTATIGIEINGYEAAEGDKVTLTVRDTIGGTILIEKATSVGEGIEIAKTDTNIEAGKYVYDLVIDATDGQRITLIRPSTFEVIEGVAKVE